MKKALTLLSLVLLLGAGASAQSFGVGLHLGTNLTKLDGEPFKNGYKAGYLIGAYAHIGLGDKWAIQPEVLFLQSNTRIDSGASGLYSTDLRNVKLNYLAIPILLNYRILKIIDLQAGPQFGILMNNDHTLLGNGKDAFKHGDFSLLFGAEVHLFKLRVFGRYGIGLNNINDVDNKEKWKNQTVQLGLGFNIL